MKIGLVAVLFWLMASPALARDQTPEESPPYQEMERIMMFFYNYTDSIDKNIEAKLAVEKLIQEHPYNPWLYDLWTAIEWNVIGLELGIPFEKRENILDKPLYRQRAEKYHQMTTQGLQAADQFLNKAASFLEQRQWLFAKTVLHFATSKFSIRFEEGLGGLRRGDQAATQGIQELKKILTHDPDFGPVFMYLGTMRYKLTDQAFYKRWGIQWYSAAYKELDSLCNAVFNKEESLAWIEKARQYSAPELWMKRNWLEATLVLEIIYNRQRGDFDQPEELVFIEQKYLPLLELITHTLPENKKYTQKLKQLEEYVQRKQTN